MLKRIVIVLVIIGLIVGGYLIFRPKSSNNNPATSYNTYKVQRGDLVVSVSGSGVLYASKSLDITSSIGGTVLWVIDEGKSVKKGDLLVKIDPKDYKNAYEQAKLNYENAKLKLEQTQLSFETQKKQMNQDLKNAQISRDNAYLEFQRLKDQYQKSEELFKKGIISSDQLNSDKISYEKAKNSYEQAEANLQTIKLSYQIKLSQLEKDIESAKISLAQAKLNLDKAKADLDSTEIRAPFSGITANISVKEGDIITANKTLLSLMDMSNLELNLEVDQVDIGKIKVGLPVKVTCEAFPDKEFEGRVKSISPVARISNNIAIFDVKVSIPNKSMDLKPGMTVDGEIIILERNNVLLIPLRAVQKVGRRSYVEVLNDGKTELVRVSLGEDDGTNVIVEDGLMEGQEIVVSKRVTTSSQTQGTQQRNPGPNLFGIFR